MATQLGGSLGITFSNATNIPASDINATFSPYITDTSNIMTIKNSVKASGTNGISFSDRFINSTPVPISYTISANTADLTLDMSAVSGYAYGNSILTVTINSGIYVYSTDNTKPALNIINGTPYDKIIIVNNGYIMGKGGQGFAANNNGGIGNGGDAISVCSPTTINNTNASAYIGGGGSGGFGNFYYLYNSYYTYTGGGGAGGGKGGTSVRGGLTESATAEGGLGGAVGLSGGNGTTVTVGSTTVRSSGGGGRVFPSTSTTLSVTAVSAGLGGSGGGTGSVNNYAGSGAVTSVGGGANQVGNCTTNSNAGTHVSGGGGGWGAIGGNSMIGTSITTNPATAGKAVNSNGNSITWTSGDTTRVYGAIS